MHNLEDDEYNLNYKYDLYNLKDKLIPTNLIKSISLSLNVEKSCQKMHTINRLVNVMNNYNLIIDTFNLIP